MSLLLNNIIKLSMSIRLINTSLIYGVLVIVAIVYLAIYYRRRYRSTLASAPLALADHFVVKYFGLVPPPNDKEKTDTLSRFLIRVGQDQRFSPISVCWSITGKPLVIVNTLKGVKDVLMEGQTMKNGVQKVQRGNLIRLIQNLVFGGKNLNNTIGEEWRWRRHILTPAFQPKQLVPKLLPYIVDRIQTLLELFGEHAESGEAIELDNVFMDVTMDIINYYLYGRADLNYDMVGGRKNLKNEHNHLGLGFQSLEVWLPFGLNKTNWAQRSFKPARDKLKEFIKQSLAYAIEDYKKELQEYERNKVPEKLRDYQSVAACAMASGKYHEDQFDLINDLISLTFAGYDTTAHTLSFTFAELAQQPDLQDELFKQVRSVLGPPPVSPESITAEKLARMPLVTAVYRETLRKYPAVVFIPVHVNQDTIVDGAVVSAGAEIWCNVRGIQMNPSYFPDPNKFDPMRWLCPEDKVLNTFTSNPSSNSKITSEMQNNFPNLAFSLGQHACLGKNLATLELRAAIACTLNQFTCTLKEGCVIDTKVVLTTKPRYGVWVQFKKR